MLSTKSLFSFMRNTIYYHLSYVNPTKNRLSLSLSILHLTMINTDQDIELYCKPGQLKLIEYSSQSPLKDWLCISANIQKLKTEPQRVVP